MPFVWNYIHKMRSCLLPKLEGMTNMENNNATEDLVGRRATLICFDSHWDDLWKRLVILVDAGIHLCKGANTLTIWQNVHAGLRFALSGRMITWPSRCVAMGERLAGLAAVWTLNWTKSTKWSPTPKINVILTDTLLGHRLSKVLGLPRPKRIPFWLLWLQSGCHYKDSRRKAFLIEGWRLYEGNSLENDDFHFCDADTLGLWGLSCTAEAQDPFWNSSNISARRRTSAS